MKKIYSLMLISIVLVSCGQDDFIDQSFVNKNGNKTNIDKSSSIRSYDEAYDIALKAAQMLDEQKGFDNGRFKKKGLDFKRKINKNKSTVIYSSKHRISQNDSDTLLYVFNYENDNGFAVVSASRKSPGLLAVTEEGAFDKNNPDNEISGLNYFIELSENYVYDVIINDSLPPFDPFDPFIPSFIEDTTYTSVGPLLEVRWGQSFPEGQYCPNGYSGCTNTAIAQIMSYWNYPQSINITYPDADLTVQPLDWTEMERHELYYWENGHESQLYCNATDSAHNALGRLCRQLGYLNQSTYTPTGTGTQDSKARETIINLGFNCDSWTNYSNGSSKEKLDDGKPLIVTGFRSQAGTGHAWVVDGYQRYYIVRYYWGGTTENRTILYNHINWGWNGLNNGYFLDNVFDTNNYHSLDAGPYNYTLNRDYDTNIRFIAPYLGQN